MAKGATQGGAAKRSKLPVLTIPSDDCAIYVGREIRDGKVVQEGKAYYIHAGEAIEIIPVANVREFLAIQRLASGLTQAGQSPADGQAAAAKAEEALDQLCQFLAERLVSWTWSDNFGEALPQPWRNPDVLRGLSSEELLYLVGAAQLETPETRKNGLRPLAGTS